MAGPLHALSSPHAGHHLNDGFWHSVQLVARDGSAVVTIDDDDGAEFRVAHPFQLRTGSQYFFGGVCVGMA